MGGERIKESEGVKDSKEIPNFIEVQDFIFFLIFFCISVWYSVHPQPRGEQSNKFRTKKRVTFLRQFYKSYLQIFNTNITVQTTPFFSYNLLSSSWENSPWLSEELHIRWISMNYDTFQCHVLLKQSGWLSAAWFVFKSREASLLCSQYGVIVNEWQRFFKTRHCEFYACIVDADWS